MNGSCDLIGEEPSTLESIKRHFAFANPLRLDLAQKTASLYILKLWTKECKWKLSLLQGLLFNHHLFDTDNDILYIYIHVIYNI